MTTEEASGLTEEYCREHFPRRFERAMHYRFREDQLRCLGAGALLYQILGAEEAFFTEAPGGKLRLCREEQVREQFEKLPFSEKRSEFNLSHSGELILLAVSDRSVGVDVEKIKPGHAGVAERVLLQQEREWMNGQIAVFATDRNPAEKAAEPDLKTETLEESERARRFCQLWTLKESVMKALGKGLSLAPESFSVLSFLKNSSARQGERTEENSIELEGIKLYGRLIGAEDPVWQGRKPPEELLADYSIAVCEAVSFSQF